MDRNNWKWEEGGETIIRSIARTPPGCQQGCGVLLHVRNGRLTKVEGDPSFPLNQGRLCPRCLALTELVYHPDRLKYPLKRIGKRGEGKWSRISWNEAYDTITDRLKQIRDEQGVESVVFCHGTGRDNFRYTAMLANSFASPNIACFGPLHGNACFMPRVAVMEAILGGFALSDCAQSYPERYQHPEWKKPECIIVWGNEPTVSNPDRFMGHWIIECMKRGSKLIVIDPRKTWLANHAEIWMQIRPGTDAALALSMLNIIINNNLYDNDFVQKWTHGFKELSRRVKEYPPEKVSEITWLPQEQIIASAKLYSSSRPAVIQWGVALDQSKECIATLHSLVALWSITGNMDAPGGNIIRSKLLMPRSQNPEADIMKPKRIGVGKYPFMDWAQYLPGESLIDQMISGKPYPIRATWIQGTNTFACGTADPRRTFRAFKKTDFNVVVDLFMTPTAMAFADIVLPVTSYPERDGVYISHNRTNCSGIINKAIEPIGECKSDMEINLEIGKRLNPECWSWNNVYEMFDSILEPTGLTFNELRERGYVFGEFSYQKHEKGLLRKDKSPGFDTPTGKVELYSTVLEKCGLDPLPFYEEPPESPISTPEIVKEFPLILTTGARTRAFFHSEHRQIPSLRQLNPDPLVEINSGTAAELDIKDGDWIYIESKYGRCKQRAKLTEDILPEVVNAQHGWWFPEKPGPEPSLFGVWESNINLLLPSGWTGKSGLGYPFKNQMCRVYKAED